jgi:hypothetical protein
MDAAGAEYIRLIREIKDRGDWAKPTSGSQLDRSVQG